MVFENLVPAWIQLLIQIRVSGHLPILQILVVGSQIGSKPWIAVRAVPSSRFEFVRTLSRPIIPVFVIVYVRAAKPGKKIAVKKSPVVEICVIESDVLVFLRDFTVADVDLIGASEIMPAPEGFPR